MYYPKALQALITILRKFPGVGLKTAERYAFHLLRWHAKDLQALSTMIGHLKEEIQHCSRCGCLTDEINRCFFCDEPSRDKKKICILASPKDVYLIEETKSFHGLYHIVQNLLSPIEGYRIEGLLLDNLQKRIQENQIEEAIIALDSTLEGDATALYFKKILSEWNISVTRLAFGIPLGSSLDFIDKGTLSQALIGRKVF
ncbi:MAG: recombination protein RecR [Parachlamydiales bacterium]|nr:recombination protein RecR [Parachlamydiales bacterium]